MRTHASLVGSVPIAHVLTYCCGCCSGRESPSKKPRQGHLLHKEEQAEAVNTSTTDSGGDAGGGEPGGGEPGGDGDSC